MVIPRLNFFAYLIAVESIRIFDYQKMVINRRHSPFYQGLRAIDSDHMTISFHLLVFEFCGAQTYGNIFPLLVG